MADAIESIRFFREINKSGTVTALYLGKKGGEKIDNNRSQRKT